MRAATAFAKAFNATFEEMYSQHSYVRRSGGYDVKGLELALNFLSETLTKRDWGEAETSLPDHGDLPTVAIKTALLSEHTEKFSYATIGRHKSEWKRSNSAPIGICS